MSKIVYSPAPWSFAHDVPEHSADGNFVIDDKDGNQIATLDDCESAEQNAPLMTIAPELLEALRECITEEGAAAWRNLELAVKRLEAISTIAQNVIQKSTKLIRHSASWKAGFASGQRTARDKSAQWARDYVAQKKKISRETGQSAKPVLDYWDGYEKGIDQAYEL